MRPFSLCPATSTIQDATPRTRTAKPLVFFPTHWGSQQIRIRQPVRFAWRCIHHVIFNDVAIRRDSIQFSHRNRIPRFQASASALLGFRINARITAAQEYGRAPPIRGTLPTNLSVKNGGIPHLEFRVLGRLIACRNTSHLAACHCRSRGVLRNLLLHLVITGLPQKRAHVVRAGDHLIVSAPLTVQRGVYTRLGPVRNRAM